jgi:hypothetical protein
MRSGLMMMIRRTVLERLRFRWGARTSEDHAHCDDAYKLDFGRIWIREDLVARNAGDLRPEEVAQF